MQNQIDSLQKLAQKQVLSYAYIIRLHVLECILARFALLKEKNIVVRGSLITRAWTFPKHFRKVQDLDFLVDAPFDEEKGKEFVQKMLAIDLEDDLILGEDYKVYQIWEETENPGLRFEISAQFQESQMEFQIDVAFNDPLIPRAIEWDYPTLLGTKIRVKTILPELACAWKIHGLFEFWDKGFRWQVKTLYDVFIILDTQSLDREIFKKAIEIAFKDRKTPFEVYQRVLSGEFGASKGSQKAWEKWLAENEGKIPYPTFEPMIALMREHVDAIFLELMEENPSLF